MLVYSVDSFCRLLTLLPCAGTAREQTSYRDALEGGLIGLETLVDLKFLDASCSSSNLSIRAFRAQISQLELFELILLLKLDNQLSIEQFEAAVSQSMVSSPRLISTRPHPPRGSVAGTQTTTINKTYQHNKQAQQQYQ